MAGETGEAEVETGAISSLMKSTLMRIKGEYMYIYFSGGVTEAVGETEGAEEDGDFLMIKLFYCFV